MNPVNRTIEFYKEMWNDSSLFGRWTLFPILVLVFPVFLFVALCVKE